MFTSAIYSHKFTQDYRAGERLLEDLRLLAIAPLSARVSKFTRAPLTVTASAFNALLAVYSASSVPSERRSKLLQDMKDLNLPWDKFTYTAGGFGFANYIQTNIYAYFLFCISAVTP
jgi:hypothetical protein